MSVKAGEGMLVGTIRESFMWKAGFGLDLLKGGSKTREVGAAALTREHCHDVGKKQSVAGKPTSW